MRLILLLSLFHVSFFVQAQTLDVDSLKNYSYLLILTKKTASKDNYNVVGIGTGFFVRNKKDLYLVSADHVFTGNDPIKGVHIDSTSPDLMVFYYEITGKNNKSFKNIYLDSIKSVNPPKFVWESPDLLPYKIDLPNNAKIKTIDRFIDNKLTLRQGDSLFFWGFPSIQPTLDSSIRYYIFHPNPIMYKGVFLKNIDSLNFMATPTTNFGASGSPVFVRRQVNGKDKLFFVGVLSSASDLHNRSFIVTYRELLKKIGKTVSVLKYQ